MAHFVVSQLALITRLYLQDVEFHIPKIFMQYYLNHGIEKKRRKILSLITIIVMVTGHKMCSQVLKRVIGN